MTETIGYIAAVLTTTAFVPQFLKVWKTRSTQDISLRMYLILCAGLLLWLIYGIEMNSLPIILANSMTLALALMILAFKIRYK
ncbi:MAG: SemiSWEET transporter [Candidatus Kryptoniota bacterium]